MLSKALPAAGKFAAVSPDGSKTATWNKIVNTATWTSKDLSFVYGQPVASTEFTSTSMPSDTMYPIVFSNDSSRIYYREATSFDGNVVLRGTIRAMNATTGAQTAIGYLTTYGGMYERVSSAMAISHDGLELALAMDENYDAKKNYKAVW
eukprot:tig00020902_g15026.t1